MFSICCRLRVLSFGLVLLLVFQESGNADELRDHSIIGQLPAQTPFVAVSRLHKQRFNAFINNSAVRRLLLTKTYQEAWEQIQNPDSDLQSEDFFEAYQWLNSTEEGKEVRDFILDAISHEVFVYGDTSWLESTKALYSVWKLMSDYSSSNQELSEEEQKRQLLKKLKAIPDETFDKIQLPNLVFGAYVENRSRADRLFAQLKDKIEETLAENAESIPVMYQDCYQVRTIGGTEYLTLEIPGQWIPFLFIDRTKMSRANEELVNFFIDGIHRRSIRFAFGVRGNHLICSIGGSFEHLEQLRNKEVLLDHPKLARLKKFAGQPISSVVYFSEEFSRIGWTENPGIEGYENYAKEILKNSANGKELLNNSKDTTGLGRIISEQLAEDVVDFGKDMLKFHTTPGARLEFSILVDAGVDRYVYDWSEHPERDAGKPLDILNYVGGEPLVVIASRKTYRPEIYEFRAKWLSRTWWYSKKVMAMFAADDNANSGLVMMLEMYDQMLRPTLLKFDEVTRELWIPAFKDGQTALVIDVTDLRRDPHFGLDERFQTYPYLPQFGYVCGISDRKKLIEACEQYRKAANRLLSGFGAIAQGENEPLQLPAPEKETVEGGTLYRYDLENLTTEEDGDLSIPVLPVAAINDHIAVIALDRSLSKKILKKTPLVRRPGTVSTEQPMSGYVYFNLAKLWRVIEEPVQKNIARQIESGEMSDEDVEIAQALLGIVKLMDSISSATTFEDGAWATRVRIRFSQTNAEN